jgi:type II secretory ATPase GspE/PulE/Tfp pilus assembly ATPase PilB-like protein
LPTATWTPRLSTFPTDFGEKVVLRLLSRGEVSLELEDLGMEAAMANRLKTHANRAHGLCLVTGPTGSGKTSTLYALLNAIDGTRRNIQTLEDPIEYRFEHVIQGQVNEKVGFSFARGLRSMLRQDPDVIMVGEMRDGETANIAFKAALTGHLVLSSLHTNSAIETFVRLFDMGLERYVVASALSAMVGQRLVRRLCPACAVSEPVTEGIVDLLKECGFAPFAHHRTAPGCNGCNGTGYRGRTGVYEVIEVDDALADLVKNERTTRSELRAYMNQRHLHGLRSAGFNKVAAGETSVEEVLRVT